MTPEQLAEIKERAEAAPRGPWHVEYFGDEGYPQRVSNQQAILIASTFEGGQGLRPIPEFIAHAREDVPALLAEVERLTESVAALNEESSERGQQRNEYHAARDRLTVELADERNRNRGKAADHAYAITRAEAVAKSKTAKVAELLAEVERLNARLKAAEAVCVAYGICGARFESDREKALYELWWEWTRIPGGNPPDLSDEEIARLAQRRDAKRTEALKRIHGEGGEA